MSKISIEIQEAFLVANTSEFIIDTLEYVISHFTTDNTFELSPILNAGYTLTGEAPKFEPGDYICNGYEILKKISNGYELVKK